MRDGSGHSRGVRWAWGVGLLALSLGVLAGVWRTWEGAEEERPWIMPLGDSLTQGTAEYPGYRVLLWDALRAQGFRVDFVGSQRNYFMRRWGAHGFDADHEGHWGWTVARLLEPLESWVCRERPDIVLLQAGINDLFNGYKVEKIVGQLGEMIAVLRRCNPRVVVCVAQLTPILDEQSGPRVPELNRAIAELGRLGTSESPVVVVDQYRGFDAQADTYDGLHPNASGAAKMAARWLEALEPVLRGAAAAPHDPGGGRNQ